MGKFFSEVVVCLQSKEEFVSPITLLTEITGNYAHYSCSRWEHSGVALVEYAIRQYQVW